jgi:hypothetical protein
MEREIVVRGTGEARRTSFVDMAAAAVVASAAEAVRVTPAELTVRVDSEVGS